MVNQIKALGTETNKELKMKYWIDRIKVKQGSSFPPLGGRNFTHKNNTLKPKPRVSNGIMKVSVGESLNIILRTSWDFYTLLQWLPSLLFIEL